MSGFAGIIHLDKKPVDEALVEKLARRTERHGGDAFSVHCDRNFGMGHSLLRTTRESADESQPFSLDGNTWITGDVRIDARDELVDALIGKGENCHRALPDIELLARAYRAWGDECTCHVLGDFAFAAWDQNEQQLFCARDSFGVKPFYYARRGPLFVFSNDIRAILGHPAATDGLNENAVSDYLAFGYNLDEKTTLFADIERIPPGHVLVLDAGSAPRLSRYTRLVFDRRIEYRREEEYTEQFLALFKQAVRDRLRTDTPAFELSGGMDSTSVAATAADMNRGNPAFRGKAFTTDSSKINPSMEEAKYARLVAEKASLMHETVDAGRASDFYTYLDTAQPYAWPFAATTLRFGEKVRRHGRVLLSGQGADPFIQGSGDHLLDVFRTGPFSAFMRHLIGEMLKKKTFRSHGFRALFNRDRPRILMQELPPWLERGAIQECGSLERWNELYNAPGRYPRGCRCELAFDELRMPFWTHVYESYYHDLLPGIDCRHPFFDIRLMNFLFAIPPLLKQDKKLLRQAMVGVLPRSVLDRKKTVVSGDIVQNQLCSPQSRPLLQMCFGASSRWINEEIYRQKLQSYANGDEQDRFRIINPLSLQLWIEK